MAPLQPPTLATVKSWGSSKGAGRVGHTECKGTTFLQINKQKIAFFQNIFTTSIFNLIINNLKIEVANKSIDITPKQALNRAYITKNRPT